MCYPHRYTGSKSDSGDCNYTETQKCVSIHILARSTARVWRHGKRVQNQTSMRLPLSETWQFVFGNALSMVNVLVNASSGVSGSLFSSFFSSYMFLNASLCVCHIYSKMRLEKLLSVVTHLIRVWRHTHWRASERQKKCLFYTVRCVW